MRFLAWQRDPMSAAISVVIFLVHLAVVCRAITRPDRSPASRIAWVAVIVSLPVVGVVAYLLLGETSIGRDRERKLREVTKRMALPVGPGPTGEVEPRAAELFHLGGTINGFRPVSGNRIRLIGDPDAPATDPMRDSDLSIDSLVTDIDAATESIHISFYIWLDDHNGGKVTDAVCAAARRGVTCRVMVDALGSRAFTKSARWQQLKDAGVHTLATLDDIPHLGHLAIGRLDLRNHRKIVVIDNRISYCGSQNCADPQFRVAAKYAPWVDIWFRCEGPIVRQEQYIFLSAWIAETGEALEHLPTAAPEPEVFADDLLGEMFGTGPTTHNNSMSEMFVATIAAARSDLLITTPYFVPDEALLRALCSAPRRGVRTRIIFPARNNSALVGASSRSTYAEMLAAGVEIYEYPIGLLHTKSITLDGEIALVGSANMDRRSLQLNFENNLVVADASVTAQVRRRQESYLSVSHRVDPKTVAAWRFPQRLWQDAVETAARCYSRTAGAARSEQIAHRGDLGLLTRDDRAGEGSHLGIARGREHLLGHGHRTLVVLDHHRDPHPVEVGAFGLGERRHVLRAHHAAVTAMPVVPAVRRAVIPARRRGRGAPGGEPAAHGRDLGILCRLDLRRERAHLRRGALLLQRHVGHLDGLLVVGDHPLREGHVTGARRIRRAGAGAGAGRAGGGRGARRRVGAVRVARGGRRGVRAPAGRESDCREDAGRGGRDASSRAGGGVEHVLLLRESTGIATAFTLPQTPGAGAADTPVKPRRRRLLPTTKTLESAIAAPASIGLSIPAAARGIAATL